MSVKLKHGKNYGRARAIGGWKMGKNGVAWDENATKSRTVRSGSRLFEDEFKHAITKSVEKAAIAGASITRSQLMVIAKQKYEEAGLEEHELTGNTRNSLTAAIYNRGRVVGFDTMPDTPEATGPMLSMKGDGRLRIKGSYKYFLVRRYKTNKYVLYPYWKVQDTSGRYASAEVREELSKEGNKNAIVEIRLGALTETYRPELVTVMYQLKTIAEQLMHDSLAFYVNQRIEWNRSFYESMKYFKVQKASRK